MDLDQTQTLIAVAGSVVGLVAAIGGAWLRWGRPRARSFKRQAVAGRDAIIGRDAIVDTITGRELAPALPGIGARMASVEGAQVEMLDAVKHIATLLESQQAQDRRIDAHEARLQALEKGYVERVVTKAESTAAWQAVTAVAEQAAHLDEPIDPAIEP